MSIIFYVQQIAQSLKINLIGKYQIYYLSLVNKTSRCEKWLPGTAWTAGWAPHPLLFVSAVPDRISQCHLPGWQGIQWLSPLWPNRSFTGLLFVSIQIFFFTYLRESLVWIIPDIRYVVTIIKFTSPDQIPMLINCKELNNFKNQLFIATVIKWITDVRVVCSVTFYILINCI